MQMSDLAIGNAGGMLVKEIVGIWRCSRDGICLGRLSVNAVAIKAKAVSQRIKVSNRWQQRPLGNLGDGNSELEQNNHANQGVDKLDYVLALVCLDFGLSSVLARSKSGWKAMQGDPVIARQSEGLPSNYSK